MIVRCPNAKNKNVGKRGHQGSRDLFGEFWDPRCISATAEASNLKFGMQNGRELPYRKKIKILVKRGRQGVT